MGATQMKTRRLTAAAAIVEFLKAQYVSRDGAEHRLVNGVFGIFGHGNVAGLGQALEELGGRELPFLQPKNEQAMVHTATAFAKARRGLGTYACTTSVGPGATNMVTGAATATVNRLPVLLLPGDIFASRLPSPVLQQLEAPQSMDLSVNDCFRPVSRYWDRINRPEQLLRALPEAMRVLSDPELWGAVTLALPQDVQAEAFDYPAHFFERRVYRIVRRCPDEASLAEAVALLRSAQRPLIIAGGGVFYSAAEAALTALAERTGIPVAMTQAGMGTMPADAPGCLGAVGATGTSAANRIARSADLVVTVGTRLSDFTTASWSLFQDPGVRFINVNVNAFDAHKHGGLPLVGDAQQTLSALAAGLGDHRVPEAFRAELGSARQAWESSYQQITVAGDGGKLTQSRVIRVLNEALGPEATVVHAAGGLPGDLHKLWRSKSSGDYHAEYGYSCMGYEIAGALGVKLAQPEREIYALVGDGSYLMLNHELVTSLQEGRKITVVLLDNHGYQCIHRLQKSCGSAGFGNEFRQRDPERGTLSGEVVPIDYVANAQSLGATVFPVQDEPGLLEALARARNEPSTCVIYLQVDPSHSPPGYAWWDVPVAEVSGSDDVRARRAQYEQSRKNQRFHY
jgi:3D-(3,5/4)-trihydroxycyclohexane-1,2-dione acylhydrolase (decyclizing)